MKVGLGSYGRIKLTISTLAVAFRLIPDTLFLVSSCGTVVIAEEGLFCDVDSDYSWTVEEDKSTVNRPSSYQQPSGSRTTVERWRPQHFQPQGQRPCSGRLVSRAGDAFWCMYKGLLSCGCNRSTDVYEKLWFLSRSCCLVHAIFFVI